MNQVYDVPIKQFKSTKKRVMNLLIKNENLRDDLELLITTIWFWDIKAFAEPEKMSAMDFLRTYRDGKLTPAETIRRTWQRIQEEHPSLRGKNFDKRHRIANQVSSTIVL